MKKLILILILAIAAFAKDVSYKELCQTLPEINGYKASKCTGMQMQNPMFGKVVSATRDYSKDKKHFTINIATGMQAMAAWTPFMMGMEIENDEQLIKITKYKGFNLGISYNKKEKNGLIAIKLSDNAILAINYENMDYKEALKVLDNINLQKIHAILSGKESIESSSKSSGIINIKEDSTWYFKMIHFSAAAISQVYIQINSQKPKFLVEYAGLNPGSNAPIKIDLKAGDKVKFVVKSCYRDHLYGPIDSTNNRFFKVIKDSDGSYEFKFEDAVGADMRYNDGYFVFYKKGEGEEPNKFVNIKSFKVIKDGDKTIFEGKIDSKNPNLTEGKIVIKDNHWSSVKIVGVDFNSDGTFRIPLNYKLTAPMYTAIFKVSYNYEEDIRVRALKGCFIK